LEAADEEAGMPVIRECLQRIKPTSEAHAQKLITIAETYSFSYESKFYAADSLALQSV